jgi:hypothetical protein
MRGRDVLVDGVLLLRLHGRHRAGSSALGILQRVEDALLDLARGCTVRAGSCDALRHGLHLREALRLAEDVRVADRHDVHRACRSLRGWPAPRRTSASMSSSSRYMPLRRCSILQHARHGVVQTGVDRAEHDHALLESEQAWRPPARSRCRRLMSSMRGADDAVAGVHHEAQQLEQDRATAG